MIIEHNGVRPTIHESARIAPNAVVCGDVTIGAETSVGFGAVLTAESGPIRVGEGCVLMEHAVLRGTSRAPVEVGNHVLVGPHAHLSGCQVEDRVFIATSACVFPHARIGHGSAIRIGAIVHIHTILPPGSSLPIHWIAAGDPPILYSPHDNEPLLDHLRRLEFSATVFGVEAQSELGHMETAMKRYTRSLCRHKFDRVLPPFQSGSSLTSPAR